MDDDIHFLTQRDPPSDMHKEKSDQDSDSDHDFISQFRFREPLTDADINVKIAEGVPANTRYKQNWAAKAFSCWQDERLQRPAAANVDLDWDCLTLDLNVMPAPLLALALKYFVWEAQKQDATPYPSDTVYSLVVGLQAHLRANGNKVNLFKDDLFDPVQTSLDAVMKERAAKGMGPSARKQSEVSIDY